MLALGRVQDNLLMVLVSILRSNFALNIAGRSRVSRSCIEVGVSVWRHSLVPDFDIRLLVEGFFRGGYIALGPSGVWYR